MIRNCMRLYRCSPFFLVPSAFAAVDVSEGEVLCLRGYLYAKLIIPGYLGVYYAISCITKISVSAV